MNQVQADQLRTAIREILHINGMPRGRQFDVTEEIFRLLKTHAELQEEREEHRYSVDNPVVLRSQLQAQYAQLTRKLEEVRLEMHERITRVVGQHLEEEHPKP